MGKVHPMTIVPELKCQTSMLSRVFIMKFVTVDILILRANSFQIHYNNIPFAGKSELQILFLVYQGVRPPRLNEQPMSDEAWDVIQRCWVKEPLERPKMNNVVESMVAMSQPMSPQINADDESLREELPSSSTPDGTVRKLAFLTAF